MSLEGTVVNGVIVLDQEDKLPEGARVEINVKPPPAEAVKDTLDKLESRFKRLAKSWKGEAAHLGTAARMAKHPAYQEIIRMGKPAIPLLLAELRREPDFWFAALRAITNENPVPESSAGKIDEMSRAWLEWGRARGLIK